MYHNCSCSKTESWNSNLETPWRSNNGSAGASDSKAITLLVWNSFIKFWALSVSVKSALRWAESEMSTFAKADAIFHAGDDVTEWRHD